MRNSIKVLLMAGSLMCASALTITTVNAAENSPMDMAITNAKSKADHDGLAKQYEAEAKDLEAKVADHKKMSQSYRSLGPTKGPSAGFVSHCDKLTNAYVSAIKQNLALAKLHHQLAEKIKE